MRSRRSARPRSSARAGEIEHGGALIHTPYFGNLMREFLQGESIICFADARADAGETLVVPLWHKTRGRNPQPLPDDHRPGLRRPARGRDRRRRRGVDRARARTPASATAPPTPPSPPKTLESVLIMKRPQDRHRRRGDPHRGRPRGLPPPPASPSSPRSSRTPGPARDSSTTWARHRRHTRRTSARCWPRRCSTRSARPPRRTARPRSSGSTARSSTARL